MARVNYFNNSATDVNTFGPSNETCAVELTSIQNEIWGYKEDIIVRKLP